MRASAVFAILATAMAVGPAGAAGAAVAIEPSAKEAQIMSAFLYNFTKFVEWPPERFSSAAAPIVLGIFGDSFIEDELAAVVNGRKINGRDLLVRRVVTLAEVTSAHVVFVGATEESRFADIRRGLKDGAVLTVGESAEFLDDGGAIRFLLEAQRLRFEINISAAQRSHLKISSQLQKLAAVVRKDP